MTENNNTKTTLNYFQQYGSSIYDERRKILEESYFEGFKVKRYEQLVDKSFEVSNVTPSWKMNHKGQLYYFLIGHSGQIQSLIKLNMDKSKVCDKGLGVYYEISNNVLMICEGK